MRILRTLLIAMLTVTATDLARHTHTILDAVSGDASVFASVVSLGELRFGMENCEDPAQRALRIAFLRQIGTRPVLDLTRLTAAAFWILSATVKRTGRSPQPHYNDPGSPSKPSNTAMPS